MKTFLNALVDRSINGICSFLKNRSGLAMTEFAMMLPVLLIITAGSFEVARYALILQKLDRIAATLSDLVARSGAEEMTENEISNIMDSAYSMAQPFDITGESMMIVTSVQGRNGQAPFILSQRVEGTIAGQSSAIGDAVNGNATLPSAFPDAGAGETLSEGETLVIAEIMYNYSPYLGGALGFFDDTVFYREAYFRPRFTDKVEFPSSP